MWKAHYKHHLYQICNGFTLPIYYAIFDRPAPKISSQVEIDLTTLGTSFEEEKFTYVRVFGSDDRPHVLPLYISDKLLAREIAYQLTSAGVTKTLKNSKKQIWPPFPLRCGIYTLHDYKHAKKEAEKINILNLGTLPNRRFDPNKVVYNVLEQEKLTKIEHKKDELDDLFSSAKLLFQVQAIAKMRYHNDRLVEFNKLREQRLQTLPLDLLAIAPMTQSSEPEQRLTNEPPATSEIF